MGLLDLLGWGSAPRPDYLASPFTEGQLQTIVWSDVFGGDYAPLTRADALAIPAVSKARSLICGTLARLPLVVLNKDGRLPDDQQPSWAYRTDGTVSPFHRALMTFDDFLFYGCSLWSVVRGSEGQILSAEQVPFEWWRVNAEGVILIHDQAVSADSVLYLPGPIEGLLDRASTNLRMAKDIDQAVATRVKAPVPVMEIHVSEDVEMSQAEQKALLTAYNKARRDPDGATVVTPHGVQLIPHGDKADSGFAVEGRNASRLDVANYTGIPASLLDGSTAAASLTYETAQTRNQEFLDYGLAQYMGALESRLSQDDVVPRGQFVRFDVSEFTSLLPSPTGPDSQD